MTDGFDLVIRAPRVISGHGEVAAAVGVREGSVAAVMALDRAAAARNVIELDSSVVLMPGLVDSHVHICEPGNTEWEGFATATRAAAAGGITTLVDMPLDTVPSTVSVAALEIKRRAAAGQCHVDVGFWGGVIPGNLGDLAPLHRAGVLGFKCFLTDSGSDDFPPVTAREMEDALGFLRDLDAPLLVHAESAQAAAAIPEATADGATAFKCTPPIREEANRELLWRGLRDRVIDLIVSDHSPATAAMKEVASRGFSLGDVARWMSTRPAQLAGLRRKGRIAVGYDADFCLFAPDQSFVVDPGDIHHRHPVTPYTGRTLAGVVRGTILRGEPADPAHPRGQLLSRDAA